MYTRKIISNLPLILIPFFVISCGGSGSDSNSSGSASSQGSQLSAVNGTIEIQIPGTPGTPGNPATPTTFLPLAGVTVKAGGKIATTNDKGVFVIKDLEPRESVSVKISHDEYWPVDKQVSLSSATTTTVSTTLSPIGKPGFFDSKLGMLYKVGLTSITLPASSYVVAGTDKPYKGEIGIISRYYDIQNGDAGIFPNSYKIIGADNAPKVLQSHGAQNILLFGDKGQSIQLAPNTTAIIELPYSSALKPGEKMKMWHYNHNTGVWEFEDNVVAKNDLYRAVISKVGMLSLGIASPKTGTVTGCVTNPKNEPQQHAQVDIIGENWIAHDLDTDDFGNFSITASAGTPFTINAQKNGVHNGLTGTFVVVAGETLELPKCISLTSPSAIFSINWGVEPRDLDAHLTFTRAVTTKPDKDGNVPTPVTNDISFNTKFLDDVFLSAESSTGTGPETIDIASLTDGKYIFSVHHFNGLSNISSSGAVATLDISGQGTRTATPPKDKAKGVNDIWNIWDVTVKSGAITVSEINTITQKASRKGMDLGNINISSKGILTP